MSFTKNKKAYLPNLLALALTTVPLATTPVVAANTDGPEALYGDALQFVAETWLNIDIVSDVWDFKFNVQPFLIPQAKSHGITTFRDRAVEITLVAKHRQTPTKPDQTLEYAVVEGPFHGSLQGTAPNYVYTPNAGYTGLDKVRFSVDDGVDGNTEGVIDIKVSGSFTAFESGQVRPLALNTTATRLYALNTPDGKIEIYDVSGDVPQPLSSVSVGLEPVAIALRNDNEAWVVNTLSDNISIVDLSATTPYVKRTLQVGDEPQDIVFAAGGQRAFISSAHRGQNSPSELQPLTPSIGRADVWVFDVKAVDATVGEASPLNIVTMFGQPARGLAVSPDGKTVYAGIFKSGNQTTTVAHNFRSTGPYATNRHKPGVQTDAAGIQAPNTGVIVKHDGRNWRDANGLSWDKYVHFDLPDYDVFEIDAEAALPAVKKRHAHVGTTLFNLAVNPKTGTVYVSNQEARNEIRFEGKGDRAEKQTVRGRFVESRITVIKNNNVTPRDLNTHLSDDRIDGTADDNNRSLAFPLQMQIDAEGENLYVAAFSSSKVGIFDVNELEQNSFTPSESNQVEVSGGGPSGLALDNVRNRLYVLTRFDNGISVINTTTKTEESHVQMYNPEPGFIVKGRPFLYDARYSSSRGDTSCGSCHIFGDTDGLAWNLGDPDGSWKPNTRPYVNEFIAFNSVRVLHPMKGPMMTQSFRGLEFQGPMHWRGDRTGGTRVNGESLEKTAFKEFRVAFPGLVGRASEPTEEELNDFADFALQLRYPPNPIMHLDESLTPTQEDGRDVFFNLKTTGFKAEGNIAMIVCNDCHETDSEIERFGTNTLMSFEGYENSQDMKVANLRSVYTKVGMFGQKLRTVTPTYAEMGDQVSGYGFSHDGAMDTLRSFFTIRIFHVPEDRLDNLIDFVMTAPTGFVPMIGQQVTLNSKNQAMGARIDLMVAQALAHTQANGPHNPKCDLVVNGVVAGEERGYLLKDDGRFYSDKQGESALTDNELRTLAVETNNSLTYLCSPAGSGERIALDRDEDGIFNGDDVLLAGKAVTTVAEANSNAVTEQDVLSPAGENGFFREVLQHFTQDYPSVSRF